MFAPSAQAIRANTNADEFVIWHGDELLCGLAHFSMASLRAMVHGLLHEARAQLRRAVLLLDVDEEGEPATGAAGATAWPTIRWERLVDNAAETKAGWSFAEDPRNREAFGGVDGKTWLAGRVAGEARLRSEFYGADGWQMGRVYEYAEAIKTFREQLLVLMHMSGGQPVRGTELVTVQYKNGSDGIRGLFVDDGAVVLVTMYKTMGMRAKAKVIHRYLPREVGELAIYYVWLAIPFWRLIVHGASGGVADWGSAYIWEPRADEAWPFPGTGSKAGGKGDSKRKQAAAAGNTARKRRIGSASQSVSGSTGGAGEEGWEEGPEEDAGQAAWWQLDPWDKDRISRQIRKVSREHMGERLGIMSWRHSVKAIYRRYVRNQGIIDMMNNADTAEGEEEGYDGAGRLVGDPFHAPSGHGARTGEGIYGRSMDESLFSTEARRIGFRRVSREWHAFCMFDSVLQEGSSSGSGGSDMKVSHLAKAVRQAAEEENRRWKMIRQVDIGAQLRKMLGPKARFRGVQEAALGAIMRQESPVVVVMGTGAGKSMLFMLPAACRAAAGGLTVVVVPLVSLCGDIKDRCDELGIECVEWSGRRPHEWPSVVLVTPEAAVGESFGHFINRQRAMGRLDRIVVDECHVVLDSGAGGGWRSRMLWLRGLVKAEVQMVYLTATLRPADEAEFGRLVGLPAAGGGRGTRWFRGTTTRGNVRYQVRRYDRQSEQEEDVVAALVEKKAAQYQEEGGKIVVYCDTVRKAEEYARRLGGLCYHQAVGTAEAKRAIVRQLWEAGGQQVFTTTNTLELGVDAPQIRVVIHVGMVRRLRDYAQESGRAGRDGVASEAVIVRAARYDKRGRLVRETAEQAAGRGVERGMWEFMETDGCVRAVLDREMDGRSDRDRCEEGEEACYRCVRQ
ncbi:P-loop containing nucleoside triphosphate hydrolase protein [Staphylotrichum tortipilum]|uniref:DNA 3'-5' helicase n=1 Tax=Staphylotrichum tortipilum TaxID=2831512 RepID=A0AAN6RPQ4_9PEZI|nr:P-loop containing nucleoside triphosphate hydrolase protein [Staphylotrichum longicolle]